MGRGAVVGRVVGMALLCLVAAVGVPAAQASTKSQKKAKLAKAKKHYKKAQAACASANDLKQLPKILKAAAQMKKYGGKAPAADELYQCVRFDVSVTSTIKFNGSYAKSGSEGGKGALHFSYNVKTPNERLVPNGHGKRYVSLSTPPNLKSFPASLKFSGTGSWTPNGGPGSNCSTITANGVTGPNGAGLAMSLDPTAKQPGKTISLSATLNPSDEKYALGAGHTGASSNCQVDSTETDTARAFSAFFAYLHGHVANDLSPVNCHSFAPKKFDFAQKGRDIGFVAIQESAAMPSPQGGGEDDPGDSRCQDLPNWFANLSSVPLYPLTETTQIRVTHDPKPWS